MSKKKSQKYDWRYYVKDSWAYEEIFRTRREARERKLPHTVKPVYVWSLKVTHCPVLGIELDYTPGADNDDSATLVMLDESRGYIIGNVRILSWQAARAERDRKKQRG